MTSNAIDLDGGSVLDGWLSRIGREHPKNVLGGLDRVRDVGARMGVLKPAKTNVVIAGTNGKGSTAVFLEQLLLASDASVGTTLSPHVHRFNERVRVNGCDVSDEVIVGGFESVEGSRGDVPLNYFEYAILAALAVFKQADLDYTVLEVGLGGRLDAVNIVDGDLSIITSIGLEHQEYLGPDRESIGREKAGILRRGRPLVYGEADMPRSIAAHADSLDVPLWLAGRDYKQEVGSTGWSVTSVVDTVPIPHRNLPVPMLATQNAAAAVQAADLLLPRLADDAIAAACMTALPGRAETFAALGRTWVLDVGHNPHGAQFFCDQIRHRYPGVQATCLFGCLADKDAQGILTSFAPIASKLVLTSTQGARGRAAEAVATTLNPDWHPVVKEELADAVEYIRQTTHSSDLVLVFGSFDLVERMRNCLRT